MRVKGAQGCVDAVLRAKCASMTRVLCEDEVGFAEYAYRPQRDVLETSDGRRDYG